jgi:hypothetical protein
VRRAEIRSRARPSRIPMQRSAARITSNHDRITTWLTHPHHVRILSCRCVASQVTRGVVASLASGFASSSAARDFTGPCVGLVVDRSGIYAYVAVAANIYQFDLTNPAAAMVAFTNLGSVAINALAIDGTNAGGIDPKEKRIEHITEAAQGRCYRWGRIHIHIS